MIGIHTLPLAAALASLAPDAPHACMMAAFAPWHDDVHLIATATADTALAGDGGREYDRSPGAADRAVFGQVMRVERLGGPGADSIGEGADRVVLVPWGYSAECRMERWGQSARWVQPGERGLFLAFLRPRAAWVDGLPTLDVFEPYQLPFPQRVREGLADVGEADGLLTVEQAFEVIELLPRFSAYRENRPAALRPLLQWSRAHPELARRYPASEILRSTDHGLVDPDG
ncbi:MAG TPA: hypothetical protein VHG08_28260 [Longimicrobium sp.]|nr:hypothetical protein [Longimicrobium sp.]